MIPSTMKAARGAAHFQIEVLRCWQARHYALVPYQLKGEVMKIYESRYYEFELRDNIMINRWHDNTDQMNYQDFKDALMNLAGFIIEHQSIRILIDANNFKFELPADNIEWRNKEFYPRITKVGEVKQALIMQKEYLQFVKDELGSDVIVPTRYFSEESEAIAWLVNHQ